MSDEMKTMEATVDTKETEMPVLVLQEDEVRHGVNVVGTTIPYPIDGGGIGKAGSGQRGQHRG